MEANQSLENIQEPQPDIIELGDVDRKAVDRIAKQFDGLVSKEKLEKMRGLPSEFKLHEELAKAYKNEKGEPASPSLEGYSKELRIPAQVCSEHREKSEEIIVHERLHQASSPFAHNSIGKHGMEGVTQALTEKLLRPNSDQSPIYLDVNGNASRVYPKETQMAKDLIVEAESKSPQAVEKLYFQNNASDLKKALGGDARYEARMEQFKKLDEADLRKR